MQLPNDIAELILLYATIPLYKFVDWIDKSSYNRCYKLMGSNPRAGRYILKNIDRYTLQQIASNPDPKIMEYVRKKLSTSEIILDKARICSSLMANPTKDPEFIKFIVEYTDRYCQASNFDDYMGLINKNRSKLIYRKYFERYGMTSEIFEGKYPFFIDCDEKENECMLIELIQKLIDEHTINISAFVQSTNSPLILKRIKVKLGLEPETELNTISQLIDGQIGNDISKLFLSINPGSIDILRSCPDLIPKSGVDEIPFVAKLIKEGLVPLEKLFESAKFLTHNDPELLELITENLDRVINMDEKQLDGPKLSLFNLVERNHYVLVPIKFKLVFN